MRMNMKFCLGVLLGLALLFGVSMTAYAAGASFANMNGGTITASALKSAIASNNNYDGNGVTVDFSNVNDMTGMYYDNTGENARQVYLVGDQIVLNKMLLR